MRLHALLRELDPALSLLQIPDRDIANVCEDSRLVRPGDLFIARPGTRADGAAFLADAQQRGAAAAVVQAPSPATDIPQVVVYDIRAAASRLAHALHTFPSRSLRTLGVTGTNGKTTTAYLLRHILSGAGKRCGMIGTVEVDDGSARVEASMTTPSATDVAGLLAAMRNNQCIACAMEVSSHALDQRRTAGVSFAGAAFTNLTGDHLDYHKTMHHYAASKALLFSDLSEDAVAVVNDGDAASDRMLQDCRARVVRFGFNSSADYRAETPSVTASGSHFVLITPDGRTEVSMKLIGRHNIENALAAAALAGEVFGLSVHQLAAGLREADGAPGRLQAVRAGQPFAVLVDYAHTDDALENVLTALRPLARGRLRVLFGCGGDRDRTKRPRMARTAQRLADSVYVTSDNPRTEDPQSIIGEIVSGFTPDGTSSLVVEADRREAIARVLAEAEPGDVVLLAGKGHENYQIVGTTRHHFDDVEEARAALAVRFAVEHAATGQGGNPNDEVRIPNE